MAFDDHLVTFHCYFDTHLCKHIDDRLCSVALLVGETAYAGDAACALTERCKDRDDREEVRTVRSVHCKCLERCSLDCDVSSVAVKLRKACTCVHEDIHDREVSLERCRIKSLNLKFSEDCCSNEEVGCCAPVAFEIDVSCLVLLTALHLEDHLCAERPVTA